jgi:hypothetical protein
MERTLNDTAERSIVIEANTESSTLSLPVRRSISLGGRHTGPFYKAAGELSVKLIKPTSAIPTAYYKLNTPSQY